MRIKREQPAMDATREREGFLWLPKTIRGETRWLEQARWQELYVTWWAATKWLDDDRASETGG